MDSAKFNISLVIDDDHIEKIVIYDEKNIDQLVSNVVKKYSLETNMHKKLKDHIESLIMNEKKKRNENQSKSVERLYYDSIKQNSDKNNFINKLKKKEEEAISVECTFSPKIKKFEFKNLYKSPVHNATNQGLKKDNFLKKNNPNQSRKQTAISLKGNTNSGNKSESMKKSLSSIFSTRQLVNDRYKHLDEENDIENEIKSRYYKDHDYAFENNINIIENKNDFIKKSSFKPIFKDKQVHERLYRNGIENNEKKSILKEIIIKNTCSFRPDLCHKSRLIAQKKGESKDELLKRLASPTSRNNEFKENQKAPQSRRITKSNSKNSFLSVEKGSRENSKNFKNSLINSPQIEKNNQGKIRPVSNPKGVESILKQDMTKSLIWTYQKEKEFAEKIKKYENQEKQKNIRKFRMESLKEIFEIIITKCNNIDDLWNIKNDLVSDQLKTDLILPTIQIINQRNIELNFQNFFFFANEIMDYLIET